MEKRKMIGWKKALDFDWKTVITSARVHNDLMKFLWRIDGVIGMLFLKFKKISEHSFTASSKSQLRWFDYRSIMPQKQLSKQALLQKENEKRSVG